MLANPGAKEDHEKKEMIQASAVTGRAKKKDEEEKKVMEKVAAIKTRRPDTIHYIEKKMVDKGIQRMDRHPVDGLGIKHPPPKSGQGGKYTWEGPGGVAGSELDPVPPAIDPRDPNYVDEQAEELPEAEAGGEKLVIGVAEVAKVAEAKEGVSRVEVDPPLQPFLAATE